jgi:dienelactone hydrolase
MRTGLMLALLLAARAQAESTVSTAPAGAPIGPTEVWIAGDAGKLQAFLWRPAGKGPFPAIVYNHGSEPDPMAGRFGTVGPFFAGHGYAVLFPYRRGTGKSEGRSRTDAIQEVPPEKRAQAIIDRMVLENDDVLAALAWLRAQPWVAHDNLDVAGCSIGGIQALLTAERPVPGLRVAVDFAGGSMSWEDHPLLQERMLRAAEAARVPVFFVQAENDFNTAPSQILAEAMRARKLPRRVRIYPPFGQSHKEGHAGFCNFGSDVWGPDVLDFLQKRR